MQHRTCESKTTGAVLPKCSIRNRDLYTRHEITCHFSLPTQWEAPEAHFFEMFNEIYEALPTNDEVTVPMQLPRDIKSAFSFLSTPTKNGEAWFKGLVDGSSMLRSIENTLTALLQIPDGGPVAIAAGLSDGEYMANRKTYTPIFLAYTATRFLRRILSCPEMDDDGLPDIAVHKSNTRGTMYCQVYIDPENKIKFSKEIKFSKGVDTLAGLLSKLNLDNDQLMEFMFKILGTEENNPLLQKNG